MHLQAVVDDSEYDVDMVTSLRTVSTTSKDRVGEIWRCLTILGTGDRATDQIRETS